jgi:cytoskeleton protein RodZ
MNTGGRQQSDQTAAQGASPVSGERETGASIDQDNGQLALSLSSGRHIMRAEELDHDGKTLSESVPQPVEPTVQTMTDPRPERTVPSSFGQRLRAAREAKDLSRSEVAQRLKLPLRLIARLEDDDYTGMDQGVYLRGYLTSYARMVGIPTVAADTVATAHMHAAPLVATGTVSRSRYLFDRYSVSATYLILTGLIVVPAVWLATHGGLEQNLARTTSLDSPVATIQLPPITDINASGADNSDTTTAPAADPGASALADTTATLAAVDPPKQEHMPVVASMAPFASQSTAATPAPEAPAAHVSTGAHSLVLKLTSPSWVEIVAADGSKLQYGLLPAGAEYSYASDGPLSVRLGNAEGAEVKVDGNAIDLAPFRRANVARLRLFGADGTEPPRAEF